MAVRKIRTAIYFTQRYEKLRHYDVVIATRSHVKQKKITICLLICIL